VSDGSELQVRSTQVALSAEAVLGPAAKSQSTAYLLAVLGFVFPVAGLHRFYLNRPLSGLLYLCTWGLLGLGTLIDLFILPGMVERENLITLARQHPGIRPVAALPDPAPRQRLTPEQHILRIAEANEGVVTVALVALTSSLTLKQARRELERLHKEGFCTVDVNAEGAKLYVFGGLRSTKPLDLDDL
jgi:hypothetical protein